MHMEDGEKHLCRACARSLNAASRTMPLSYADAEDGTGADALVKHSRECLLSVSYALPFEGVVRAVIHAFKYQGAVSLAELLASAAALAAPSECDLIVPVPLHSTRRRERGYNQALLIAHKLGDRMALPVLPHALARTRATESQARLERALRFTNTLRAFQARGGELAHHRVLLLDDVVTTGATLRAAGAAVLEAGADSVALVAVAGPP